LLAPPLSTYTLSLHDALPIWRARTGIRPRGTTGTVVGRHDELEPRREHHDPVAPGDTDLTILQRRPESVEHTAGELRALVEEQQIGRATSELQSRFDLVCRLL